MKKYVIWPVAKNPAMGRIGPTRWQDWYRGCIKSAAIERKLIESGNEVMVAIVNAVHTKGYTPEYEYSMKALKELGTQNIHIELKSYETISELDAICEIAKREGAELVVVSTFAHYLRVAWLLRRIPSEHHIAFGLPRWSEMITDVVLTVLFPIIDFLGGRKRFLKTVNRRRLDGKH